MSTRNIYRMNSQLIPWFKEFSADWYQATPHDEQEVDHQFEAFCNYYLINSVQNSSESPFYFMTSENKNDNTNDFHIDGVAVYINGVLCGSTESLENISTSSKIIEVSLHLVQAKNGKTNLNAGDLNNFISAAKQFATDTPWTEDFTRKNNISDQLVDYQHVFSGSFEKKYKVKPTIHLHWCTSQRQNQKEILPSIDVAARNEIESLPTALSDFASNVHFSFYGYDELIEIADKVGSSNECKFNLGNNVPINFPSKDDELCDSFFTFIPGNEFLKIICREDGSLDHTLFNENVRDFQGTENAPFKGMTKTLTDPDSQDLFAFMNNGVTIVASEIGGNSREKHLSNYQIVNGCQTSHALYQHRDNLEDVHVPLRVIKTSNTDILDKVTYSTNSQNKVTAEDMAARSQTARKLEHFCRREDVELPIAFERRTGQFTHTAIKIPKKRIFSKKEFTKAYVACVKMKPHAAIGYFDRYQNGGKDDIWLNGASIPLLYLSTYLVMKINELRFYNDHTNLKYHFASFLFYDLLKQNWHLIEKVDSLTAEETLNPKDEKELNNTVNKVLKILDNNKALAHKIKPAQEAARAINDDEVVSRTKSGKLARSSAKKEGLTNKFLELSGVR